MHGSREICPLPRHLEALLLLRRSKIEEKICTLLSPAALMGCGCFYACRGPKLRTVIHCEAGNKHRTAAWLKILLRPCYAPKKTSETAQVDKKQGKLRVNYLRTWLAEGEE
jgi:hypothetical protein